MKTVYVISVYILTDSQGEWWERLKRDGSTSMWESGKAIPKRDREFTSAAAAKTFARNAIGNRRYKVIELVPPVPPSREWVQTIVYEKGEQIESKINSGT